MKNANFIIFIILFLWGFLLSQQIPDKVTRKQLMYQFNQKYDNQFKIRWNENTGTPSSIIGSKISKYRGSAREIAKAFLIEQKEMLGIANVEKDIKLERTNISKRGGKRLLFIQKYKGIPVLNSGYLIAINNNGEIYYLSGDYYPEIIVSTKPGLSQFQVKNIVLNDLSKAHIVSMSNPILYIYPEEIGGNIRYLLVYQLRVKNNCTT